MMRRVVVTGMGLVSPLGVGVEAAWKRVVAGESGVRRITEFDVSDLPAQIAGVVPRGTAPDTFDPNTLIPPKEQRRVEDFMLYALAASDEAVKQAGLGDLTDEQRTRTGVLIGSGIGGFKSIAENAIILKEQGPRRISPYFIPRALINEASGMVSIRHQLRGPNHAVVTACATGAHAIGDASRLIQFGDADVMVAGGTEGAVDRLTIAGFAVMRALSTRFNDRPSEASRPWDAERDGFVLGEGAGVLVLEEYEHARRRGAPILAEVLGYGLSGDAFHLSAPEPSGDGAYRAMRAALTHAGVNPDQLDYLNAHATSTPVGDPIELSAVRRLLGDDVGRLAMSSTKSATGHLLGAAGAAEAIFTMLALRDQVAPPTLNLNEPCEQGFNLVPRVAQERSVRYALSNSFGFGGTNAALVLGKV
jgi:3-oxoacyl-[acyl-carrier-protein] synthase II